MPFAKAMRPGVCHEDKKLRSVLPPVLHETFAQCSRDRFWCIAATRCRLRVHVAEHLVNISRKWVHFCAVTIRTPVIAIWYEAKTDVLPFRTLQLRHQVGNVFLAGCNRGAHGGGAIQREANIQLAVGRGG